METNSDDSKPLDGGGNVPIPVPVDRTEGVAKEVGDQCDVKVQVRVNEGDAPVDEGGGAVLVPVDSKGGTVHIQVPDADNGGNGPVHTEGGGHVSVQAPVDDDGGAARVPVEEGGNVAVPVNDSGGTAPIEADGGIDVQDLFAEGGEGCPHPSPS